MKLLSINCNFDDISTRYSLGKLSDKNFNIIRQTLLSSGVRQALGHKDIVDGEVGLSMLIEGNTYELIKSNKEGHTTSVLYLAVNGKRQEVARGNEIEQKLSDLIKGSVSSLVKFVVDSAQLSKFSKDFSVNYFKELGINEKYYPQVDQLQDIIAKKQEYMSQLRKMAKQDLPQVTKEQIDKLNKIIEAKQAELSLHGGDKFKVQIDEINSKLFDLGEQQYEIDEIKARLEQCVVSSNQEGDVAEQLIQLQASREDNIKQFNWFKKEYDSINSQLADKQLENDEITRNTSKLAFAKIELARVDAMKSENIKLLEQLDKEQAHITLLSDERARFVAQLSEVDDSIGEIKANINVFEAPSKTMGEMLEAARIEVKLAEATTQLERINSELSVKDSQLSSKENASSALVKQVNRIVKLDNTITPYKAKNVILSVLEGKAEKIDYILTSLKSKQQSLNSTLEELNKQDKEVTEAIFCVEALINAEEILIGKDTDDNFSRLASQAGNILSNAAASATKYDKTKYYDLKEQLTKLTAEHNYINEELGSVKGSLQEINRFVTIYGNELRELNSEKTSISRKYQQIVTENFGDETMNYFKALENDSSSKFIAEAVAMSGVAETETKELRKNIETLIARKQELSNRIAYLKESYNLVGADTSIDVFINGNEQMKNQLGDLSDRLSSTYAQHKAVSANILEVDGRIMTASEQLLNLKQQIKSNDKEMASIKAKTQDFISQDVNETEIKLNLRLADVAEERAMLIENKNQLEEQLLLNRAELTNIEQQINKVTKLKENNEHFISVQEYQQLKSRVDEHFALVNQCNTKLEIYNNLSGNSTDEQKKQLAEQCQQLMAQREKLMVSYLEIAKHKSKMTAVLKNIESLRFAESLIVDNGIKLKSIKRNDLSETVKKANRTLTILCNTISIVLDGDIKLLNRLDGSEVDFASLAKEQQLFVYVSLLCSFNRLIKDTFVVIGDIGVDKKMLLPLTQLRSVNFVVKVSSESVSDNG